MPKLMLLADSEKYLRNNCYQHQLLEHLEANFEVTIVSQRRIRYFPLLSPERFDFILSVMRQRTLFSLCEKLSQVVGDAPLHIYDQDPWENFLDNSSSRGTYEKVLQLMNIRGILTTSNWWAKFTKNQGMPAKFVRMGVLRRYCDVGPKWMERKITLGFQGTIHDHRHRFFNELNSMGIGITILPSSSHQCYLSNLHDIRIYIHSEKTDWKINGESYQANSLWIKDVEVAARGCFAIRNSDEDEEAYDIKGIPSIFTFNHIKEIPDIINSIESLTHASKREMVNASVNTIRERNDWQTIVDALLC